MWYESSYRRHLCDMHIEDWSDEFLSEFSPEDYYNNLKSAQLDNAMLYFQSHVGYCYYPTKTGYMHKSFNGNENKMKRLVDMCRANGITVTGYYSLLFNTWAHDKYPEWQMREIDGISQRDNNTANRYGLCCLNNKEYRAFVLAQMEEMNEYFDFDGMFFDMPFWPHMCFCDGCKQRWAEEVGGDIPTNPDWNDERWSIHVNKRIEWMGEFTQWVANEMKRLRSGISVEFNFAAAVQSNWEFCCGEPVNEASDYTGGDLYGGIYNQSFTCKFYRNITKNQPFEYMFSRCEPNLTKHTITKSDDVIASSVFLTCAHHGATLVIDAIDPVGTMDSRVYDKIGKVFDKEKLYEPYLNGEMTEDIGVYYSIKSKFSMDNNSYTNHTCAVNAVKTMVENHIPVGVTGIMHDLSNYKAIIASCLTFEDKQDNDRLIEYVKNGGTLYISGGNCRDLIEALTGGKIHRVTDENVIYIAPKTEHERLFEYFNAKYPLPFDGHVPVIDGVGCNDVIATITLPYTKPTEAKFSSIHSNPPGISTNIPAIIMKKVGNGTVIWSAAPIEFLETGEYKRILLNLIKDSTGDKFSVISDAPENVEIICFNDAESILVSAVLLNENYKAKIVDSFNIKIFSAVNPEKIVLLPVNEEISFDYDGEYACFKTKPLNIFDMYKISAK